MVKSQVEYFESIAKEKKQRIWNTNRTVNKSRNWKELSIWQNEKYETKLFLGIKVGLFKKKGFCSTYLLLEL